MAEEDQLAYLRQAIEVSGKGDSEYYAISYKATDGKRAKQVVDAVITHFVDYVASEESKFRSLLGDSLTRERQKQEEAVTVARTLLEEPTSKYGLLPTPTTPGVAAAGAAADPLADLRALQIQSEVDIVLLTAMIETSKGNGESGTAHFRSGN